MTSDARFLQAWLLALDRFELRLRGNVGRARNALIINTARSYANGTDLPAHLFVRHERRVAGILEAHYQKVIPYFADRALSQIKSRKFEQKALEGLFAALVREWVSRQALSKAKMIARTDRNDIINAITEGLEEGEGVANIAKEIRRLSAMTPWRAAVIARTETHGAATYGSIQSVRQAEEELGVVMLKRWVPTLDARTREDHAAMNGKPAIPLGEKFKVGSDLMDRPGDPAGSAGNVVSCRCALTYEEAE